MSYGPKRFAPKRHYKSRKPAVKKSAVRKKAVAQGLDQIRRSFKMTTALTPGQGVLVSNYIRSFVSPQPGATSGTLSWSTNPECRLFRSMYDRFRINSISIRIVPRANVQLSIGVGGSSQNNSQGMYYVGFDRDSVGPSSVIQMKRLKSTKAYSQLKGCRHTYSIKYPKGVTWDTLADYDSPESGTRNMMQSLGIYGGITIYGENFPENADRILNNTWADMELSYNMTFYSYSPRDIQYDPETDQVTIRQTDEPEGEAVQPLVYTGDPSFGTPFNLEVGETPAAGVVTTRDA